MTPARTHTWLLALVAACGGGGDGSAGSFGSLGPPTGAEASAPTQDPGTTDPGATSTPDPTADTGDTGPDPTVDPSDTGVVPGSTIDATDYPSIQAAIDALEGIGGAVYVPAGEHRIPEKLRVHSNITVFGAGIDQTILRLEDGAEVDELIANDSSSGRENIGIRALTLQGPGAASEDCCNGLSLEHVKGALVADVAARDHGRDGFYLGYKHVDGVPQGVFDTRLSGLRATGNGRNGLSIVQGENILVDGGEYSENNLLEDVAAIDLEPDPYPDGFVRKVRILHTKVASNKNNGIQMWAEGGAIVADNAICWNALENNDGTAIADHQSDDDVFVGNTFSNNGADADYDGSALVGDEYANLCGDAPALPPLPPLPP
jgi:hypothetical protein